MNKDTIKRLASFAFTMLLAVGLSGSVFAQYTWEGPELIEAGDFAGDTLSNSWAIEGGTNGTVSVVNGELALTEIADVPNQYDFQVNQSLSAEDIAELAKGGTIEVSFDARTNAASGEKTFHVFLGEVGGGWARYWQSPGDGDVTVTNTMDTYTLTIQDPETWGAMRLGFEVSGDTSAVYIDNVSLNRVSENVLANGNFDGDSLGAWTTAGTADFTVDSGEVAITNFTAGNSFDVQLLQEFNAEQLDSIYNGPYEILFEARTDGPEKTFVLFFGNNGTGGSWENFTAAANPTVTGEMTQYQFPVTVDQTWANMKFGFEVSADATPVIFDNIILRRVRDVPPPVPTFTLSTADGIVTINITAVEGAASYDVFFSSTPIDSLDGPDVSLVGNVDAETGLSIEHTTKAPHPTLAQDFTAYYAVTAKTEKGATSAPATDEILTGMSAAENYAVEVGIPAVDAAFDAIDTGVFPEAATLASFFPEGYTPFMINENNGLTVNGSGVDSDADLSSKHWIGFNATDNVMIIYAEVTDDSLVFASEQTGSGGAWDNDSWEMGIGNYSPASFIAGSDHTGPEAGEEPDWQLRGGALSTDTGIRGFIHAYGYQNGARLDGEIPNAATIVEVTATGYRTLSLINMVSLAIGDPFNDAAWAFPSGTEVKTYPLGLALNDNDGNARDNQILWADKSENGDWWQRPQQWDVVAFVGVDAVPVSNENEDLGAVSEFKLKQNYPNPFNPTTNIQFELASSSDVTLEVFNMLGQKVATLINGEKMNAGTYNQTFDASSLASGMYVYRISTANFVQSRTMMLIK